MYDYSIEDLLFRAPADFLTPETRAYYRRKNVLITGGGGSIGSKLARQIAKCEPSRLVLLDVYENGAYDVQQELKRKYPDLNLRVEIASICDKEGLEKIFSDHTPDIVLYAAAHKPVPLMERNCKALIDQRFSDYHFDVVVNLAAQAGVRYSIDHPDVYIQSNVIGFYNILEACRHNPVEHLVYASSSSVYGGNKKVPFSVDDKVDNPVLL